VLWNYFDAVRRHWPQFWNDSGRGQMLNKSNGFRGLMRFLREAYLFLVKPGEVPSSDAFLDKIFSRIEAPPEGFDVRAFKPGTSGEVALYQFLKERSGLAL
ncbi:MAG: hypothetical protein WBP92_10290, partial [Candidatus Acidiferrales bacterium]